MRLKGVVVLLSIGLGGVMSPVVGAVASTEEAGDVASVPITAILADPSRYQGGRAAVVGVLEIVPEGERLCLTREHAVEAIWAYCVSFSAGGTDWKAILERMEELREWNGDYVRVIGTIRETGPILEVGLFDIEEIYNLSRKTTWRPSRNEGT